MAQPLAVDLYFEDVNNYLHLPWNDFEAFVKVMNKNHKRFERDTSKLNPLEKRKLRTKRFDVFYKPHYDLKHVEIKFKGDWDTAKVKALTGVEFEDSGLKLFLLFEYISYMVETFNLTPSKTNLQSVDEIIPNTFDENKASMLLSQAPVKLSSRLSEYTFVNNKFRALWIFYFEVLNPKTILYSDNWKDFYWNCSKKKKGPYFGVRLKTEIRQLMKYVKSYSSDWYYDIENGFSTIPYLVTEDDQSYQVISETPNSKEQSSLNSTVHEVLNNIDQPSLGYGFKNNTSQMYTVICGSQSLPLTKSFHLFIIQITNLVKKAQSFFSKRHFTDDIDDFMKAFVFCLGHMRCEGCCCAIISNNEESVIISLDNSRKKPQLNTIEIFFKQCHVQYISRDEPTIGLQCAIFAELIENRFTFGEYYVRAGNLETSFINFGLTKGYVNDSKFKLDRSRYFYSRFIWMNVFQPHIKNSEIESQLTQVYSHKERKTCQLVNVLNYYRMDILATANVPVEQSMELVNSKDFWLRKFLRGEIWNIEQTAVTYMARYKSLDGVLKRYDPVRCLTNSSHKSYLSDGCQQENNFSSNMAFLFIREFWSEVIAYKKLTKYYKERYSKNYCDFIPRLYHYGYMFIDKLETTTKDTLYEDPNLPLQQEARGDCPFIFVEKLIPVSKNELLSLTSDEKGRIKRNALKCLSEMHAAGVYHNSIKESNVIITRRLNENEEAPITREGKQKQRKTSSAYYKPVFIDFGEARTYNISELNNLAEVPDTASGKLRAMRIFQPLSPLEMATRDEKNLKLAMDELLKIHTCVVE